MATNSPNPGGVDEDGLPNFMEWSISSDLAEAIEHKRVLDSTPVNDQNRAAKAELTKVVEQRSRFFQNIAVRLFQSKSRAARKLETAHASPCGKGKGIIEGLVFEPSDEFNSDRLADDAAMELHTKLGLHTDVVPTKFQAKAAEKAFNVRHWTIPQLSLYVPHAPGRTLPILIAVAKIAGRSRGPTIVVTTPPGCDEWMKEHARSFGQNKMPALCIQDDPGRGKFPNMFDYKLVVTSHNYLQHEAAGYRTWRERLEWRKRATNGARDATMPAPIRPRLVLMQEIFMELGDDGCELLVLDDGDAVSDFDRNRQAQVVIENKRATIYMHPAERDPEKEAMGYLYREFIKRNVKPNVAGMTVC